MNSYLQAAFYICLIYIGTVCYVIAAYYHLKMSEKWTFLKAFTIAVPFVLIEYCFSLNGNYYIHQKFGYSAMDILIMTICFYFINLWLLNYFILEHTQHNMYVEAFCFALVIGAFLLTNVIQ
jgi:hypothetical protein